VAAGEERDEKDAQLAAPRRGSHGFARLMVCDFGGCCGLGRGCGGWSDLLALPLISTELLVNNAACAPHGRIYSWPHGVEDNVHLA
jgi:hypothetical protein